MSIPYRKRPGAGIRASEFNAIRDAAQAATTIQGGSGMTVDTHGHSITIHRNAATEAFPNCIRALFTTPDVTLPRWGVVEYYQAVSGRYSEARFWCRYPITAGFSRIGIAQFGAAKDQIVTVQIAGISPVLVTPSTVPANKTLAAGVRLGCQTESPYAQWDDLGPFRVHSVEGDDGLGHSVAMVEIAGERGDMKFVVDPAGISYVARTIVWADSYTVSGTTPGVPTVSLA